MLMEPGRVGRVGGTHTPYTGVGAESIVVNGVTFTRVYFGGQPLDQQISSQPLYGRAA